MSFIKDYLNKLCCKHDWEEMYRVETFRNPKDSLPIKHSIILNCKKCGNLKRIEL